MQRIPLQSQFVGDSGSAAHLQDRWRDVQPKLIGETLRGPRVGRRSCGLGKELGTTFSSGVPRCSIGEGSWRARERSRRRHARTARTPQILALCGRGAFNPPVPRVANLSGARGTFGAAQLLLAGARSHAAGTCGHRAARPAGGNAGPDRALHAREGNSEGPHAGLCPAAGGIARAGGSEGWARRPARAIAPCPRSKKKEPSRSDTKNQLRVRGAKHQASPRSGTNATGLLRRPADGGTPRNDGGEGRSP